MILLKTVVLFVLANPAELYPLTDEEEAKHCGLCSNYIELNALKVPEYPNYDKLLEGQSLKDCFKKHNEEYLCGQANENGLPGMKTINVTETKNTKIIGGLNAQQNEFPWQVGLAFGYGSIIECGGSIINSKYILTAAHCLQEKTYKDTEVFPIKGCIYAVVGAHFKYETRKGEMWNRICDVKVHKDFKGNVKKFNTQNGNWETTTPDYYNNDFGILKVCRELLFTPKVSPVCLPKPLSTGQYEQYEGNHIATASGWGLTQYENSSSFSNELKKVHLTTMSNDQCFGGEGNTMQMHSHESKICAADPTWESATCQGDSGGPLVIKLRSNGVDYFTLIGVTSYGHQECLKAWFPTVFGRVSSLKPHELFMLDGTFAKHPDDGTAVCSNSKSIELRKDTKNSRSLKNTEGVTYYHFEKDKKLSRKKAQETCISKYGGQLTSINTQDEYDWIKEQVIDLKMFGQIAIGGQWKDKSSRKFEWTDKSEMDMSVLNANWFRTRNYQFPSYKNKKRINLELWYSRRALGFANALDHKAPTMYICKVAPSCSA